MPCLVVAVRGCQLCEPTSRVKRDRCDLDTVLVSRLLPVQRQHLSRSNQPWNPLRFRRSSFGSRRGGCWEDVPFRPCQVLEQGIHVHIHHAGQDETTGRPRVYVLKGPGYSIAVSGKPYSARYPGRSQAVVFRGWEQGILGIPRVAGHADRSVGVA